MESKPIKNLTVILTSIITLVLFFVLGFAHCGSDCYGLTFWENIYQPALGWVVLPVFAIVAIIAFLNIFLKIVPEKYLDRTTTIMRAIGIILAIIIFFSPYSYLSVQYNLGIEYLYSSRL